MTTITDADREAAAQYFEAIDGPRTLRASNARLGRMDDLQTVQAFARHREAALEEAAKVAEKWFDAIMATPHENATYRSIATAIRALKGNNDAG